MEFETTVLDINENDVTVTVEYHVSRQLSNQGEEADYYIIDNITDSNGNELDLEKNFDGHTQDSLFAQCFDHHANYDPDEERIAHLL